MKIVDLKNHPEHLATIAHWHHQQWGYLNPNQTLEMRMDEMRAHLLEPLVPTTFVAFDQTLLGSAAIVVDDMDTHPELTPWLASVYVAPEFRRRGIGSKLVRHMMEQARQHGYAELYLFSPDRARFYAALGWQVLSQELYRGYPVTVMNIPLSS